MFSAAMAVSSVGLNYYGTLLTERKRAELQKEVGLPGHTCAAGRCCFYVAPGVGCA
jgi:hypothetical protein